jgi:hypothetical protein
MRIRATRVDPSRKADPRFIALDFGIMGSLAEKDQFWLAENFMALFERDYKRIAELHVAAGWMPAHLRMDELEAAIRTVCEPYFTRPLSQISMAEVVMKLFSVARRYELTLQPQLILLQKTLLNIEGIGRLLHPQIDIWATAKPVLADILRRRYGIGRTLRELRAPAGVDCRGTGNAGAGAYLPEEGRIGRLRCGARRGNAIGNRGVGARDRARTPARHGRCGGAGRRRDPLCNRHARAAHLPGAVERAAGGGGRSRRARFRVAPHALSAP